jgi:TolA-binding protein
MRHLSLRSSRLAIASLVALAVPAYAQSVPVETRVDRLEKEMRAIQRKVFPGGAPIEPEITRQPTAPITPGTPASTPLTDLTARVDALEGQLASLTGQTEQNAYRLKQLEEAFNKYKAEQSAAAPATVTVPPNPAPGGTASVPRPPAPAGASDARRTAVAAVERPNTGDAASDAYSYGFRLWDAKFYPEAQEQLKATVDKYGSSGVASRAANLLGRAYLDDGKPALAAQTLYDNYQKRPKGDRAADSLAWLGESLIQLKKASEACKVYGEMEQVYGATLSTSLRTMMDKGRTRAKCGA